MRLRFFPTVKEDNNNYLVEMLEMWNNILRANKRG